MQSLNQQTCQTPGITLDFSRAPQTSAPLRLHPAATWQEHFPLGPYVHLSNGGILAVKDHQAWCTWDEGLTWQQQNLWAGDGFLPHPDHTLLRLSNGEIWLVFVDLKSFKFKWWKGKNAPAKTSQAHLYLTRSLDDGQSWSAPQLLQQGYVATSRSLVELADGRVVLSLQNLDYALARHYAYALVTQDGGASWLASNRLDLPGHGHHDGIYEGSIIPLASGALRYYLRSNDDCIYQAHSTDGGRTWLGLQPDFAASSSPLAVSKLQDGRWLLLVNPLRSLQNPQEEPPRRAGQFSQKNASWYRAELALCISYDEGQTWSSPLVVAALHKAWLAYPHVFEVSPGKLWISTMQSGLRLSLDLSKC